jgi:hypothetical protein
MVISIGDYVQNFRPKVRNFQQSEGTPMPISLQDDEDGPDGDPPAALQLAA